uniref:Uncharacterized protein n=1 Tax=Leptobrachium leishanense TaxID=445787 RepID=A0A8C5M8H8_9ANUR
MSVPTGNEKPAMSVSTGTKPAMSVSTGTKPAMSVSTGTKPAMSVSTGTKPAMSVSTGTKPAMSVSTGTMPAMSVSTGTKPAMSVSSGTKPAMSVSTGTKPAMSVSTGTKPAMSVSTGTKPAMSVSTGTKPAMSVSTGTKPAMSVSTGTKPAMSVSTGTKPAMSVSTGTKPAMSVSTGTKPAMSVSTGTKPAMSVSTDTKPAMSASPGTKPAMSASPGTKPAMSGTGNEKPAMSGTGNEKPAMSGTDNMSFVMPEAGTLPVVSGTSCMSAMTAAPMLGEIAAPRLDETAVTTFCYEADVPGLAHETTVPLPHSESSVVPTIVKPCEVVTKSTSCSKRRQEKVINPSQSGSETSTLCSGSSDTTPSKSEVALLRTVIREIRQAGGLKGTMIPKSHCVPKGYIRTPSGSLMRETHWVVLQRHPGILQGLLEESDSDDPQYTPPGESCKTVVAPTVPCPGDVPYPESLPVMHTPCTVSVGAMSNGKVIVSGADSKS